MGAYRFLQTSMANLADQTIELADVLGYRGRAHHRRSGSVAELGRMFRSTRCPVSSTYRSSARGQPGNHLCLGSVTPGARIGSHHRPDRGHRLEPKNAWSPASASKLACHPNLSAVCAIPARVGFTQRRKIARNRHSICARLYRPSPHDQRVPIARRRDAA